MLRVLLLGMVELHVDGEPRPPPDGAVARGLLAWLALNPGVHDRPAVAGALWPGKPPGPQLDNLKTALSKVRAAIGPAFAEVCVNEPGRLGLRRERTSTDIADVAALAAAGRASVAVSLLRGDALPGIGGAWADEARARHISVEGQVLGHVAELAAAAGEQGLSLTYARRRLDLAPRDDGARAQLARLEGTGRP